MTTDQNSLSVSAARIQQEALDLYGRRISEERALEIAKEIRRYDEAIQQLADTQGFNDEPASFVETLVRLRFREIE